MPTPHTTSAGPAQQANYQPFAHVAYRGDSPESAETYICASPNWGYPMGYKGRIEGKEVTDHATLRSAYYAIIAEAIA